MKPIEIASAPPRVVKKTTPDGALHTFEVEEIPAWYLQTICDGAREMLDREKMLVAFNVLFGEKSEEAAKAFTAIQFAKLCSDLIRQEMGDDDASDPSDSSSEPSTGEPMKEAEETQESLR